MRFFSLKIRVLINVKHEVFGDDKDLVIKHWTWSDPFDTKELKTQKIAQLNATAKRVELTIFVL